MFRFLVFIYVIFIFSIVSSKINYAKLPERVKNIIRHKWEACCKGNKCISNSCYIIESYSSTWPSVRQRCQSKYPDWPYTVDILQIKNEADLQTFWTMLQNHDVSKRNTKTIWTSGSRCPKASYDGTTSLTTWVSTKESFPAWLEEKLNVPSHSKSVHLDRCEFLAITLAPDAMDVEYDFQDQNARHSTICEFSLPDVEWTTEPDGYTEISQSPLTNTSEDQVSKITIPVTTKTNAPNDIEDPDSSETDMESVSSQSTGISVTTTYIPRFCKAVNRSGISWPDTSPGKIAKAKCPKGMTGSMVWKCNGDTLKFWPEKPETEGCKHEWINDIDKSISEGDDPVEISRRLARETEHNNVSHGDITALVNLTTRLFKLYVEEKTEEEFEDVKGEKVSRYYNFTKSMISSISNIIREEIKDAWEELNEVRQTREASTILKLVTTIGSRLSCMKTSSEKLQFTVSEKNIDLQTFILNHTARNDEIVKFPQETKDVKANSFITLPANLKLERWYSPCKNYVSAVGVVYKHVGDFLKAGQQEKNNTRIATKVLSFSLSNSTESISLAEGKVVITLKHLKSEEIKDRVLENPRCVFWNFSKSEFGEWDRSGCILLSYNKTHTVCQCDHITNFAVLMDVNDIVGDNDILTWMTYVCCGFSIISLLLTLICFLAIRSLHGRRSIITGNLCFSLLISNGLIIFGLDKTHDKIICAVVAGILHYWLLSAFCWMLVEGYHLYRMVILVFQRGSILPVKFYYLFAYGVPLIIVGISAGIRNEGYGGSKYCWLSSADRGLIWSFVGPACVIIVVNIVIFALTLRSASSVKIKKEQSTIRKIKSWIRGSISVMCLLGLTWCIGLFYIKEDLHFFSYIFTFLNGLQGVFIFLFHIILNEKVINFFSCKGATMHRKKKFLNHTSSNHTNSKTSTRTSMNSLGYPSSCRLADNKNSANGHSVSVTRSTIVSNGKEETEETGKKFFKKNKVTHATSNGLRSQISIYDTDVRIRSGSASSTGPYRKNSQVLKKSSLTPL